MSPVFYQITHVLAAILLVAYTIHACADPKPERRKTALIVTGVLSLLVLIAGFGLASKIYGIANPLKFTGWMVAKVVVWILLSGLTGMAFRRSTFAGVFMIAAIALTALAVYLVYTKPVLFGI